MFVTGEEIVIEVEDSGQRIHDEVIIAYSIKASRRKKAKARIWISKGEKLVEDLNGSIANRKRDLGGALFIIALPKREV